MLDLSEIIKRLYDNVLQKDIKHYQISEKSIRHGVYCMAKAYSAEHGGLNSSSRDFPDYNDPAFRCGYLHKYAAFHTYVVLDVMLRILQEKEDLFQDILNGQLQMCCLGGGPGTEVVGILLALHLVFSYFKISLNIIDCMEDWDATFVSVIQEIKFGQYGAFSDIFSSDFEWNYLGANLLTNMTNETNKCIGQASLVTMVKFLSAASCTVAETMLEKIFRVLKPGALVLYIDNAAGGFTQAVERAAAKNDLHLVVGPRKHALYENESFKIERFGSLSCCKTTVTVLLLQKRLQQHSALNVPFFNQSFSHVHATNYFGLPPQLRNNMNSKPIAWLVKEDNLNRLKASSQPSTLVNNLNHLKTGSQKPGENNMNLNSGSQKPSSGDININRVKSGSQKPSSGDNNLIRVMSGSQTPSSGDININRVKSGSQNPPMGNSNLNRATSRSQTPSSGVRRPQSAPKANSNRKSSPARSSRRLGSGQSTTSSQSRVSSVSSQPRRMASQNPAQREQTEALFSPKNAPQVPPEDEPDDGCCACCVIS